MFYINTKKTENQLIKSIEPLQPIILFKKLSEKTYYVSELTAKYICSLQKKYLIIPLKKKQITERFTKTIWLIDWNIWNPKR